jgi:maleylpyruvate isomerase
MEVAQSISGCREATAVLFGAVGGLSDAAIRKPSLLPGWSVSHVLAHLARNADSHRRMVEAAAVGLVVDQYPGGSAQRDGEIAASVDQPTDVLLDDLSSATAALDRAWDALGPAGWEGSSRRWGSQPWPIADQPFLRWREVALHSSDLGLDSLTPDSWSDRYVDHELRRQLAALSPRLPGRLAVLVDPTDLDWDVAVMGTGTADPEPVIDVSGTARRLLAWLVGRGTVDVDPVWPTLASWTAVP